MPIKINPSQLGWIKKLVELHKSENKQSKITIQETNWQNQYYQYLQNTGLLYGHAILQPEHNDIDTTHFNDNDKTKLILLDSILIGIKLQKTYSGIKNLSYDNFIFQIVKYYQQHYPGRKRSIIKNWFKKYSYYEQLESIINKRLQIKKQWQNFFIGFFCNAFIALDALLIPDFIAALASSKNNTPNFRIKKIQYIILQIIIAAMQASGKIKLQEKKLFRYFLYSSNLNFYQKQRLKQYLRHGITLNKIDCQSIQNLYLKKYIFEIALLVAWADKEVEEAEEQFIDALAAALRLPETEADESCIQIEKFVLNNWQNVHFLQEQFNYQILTQRLTKQTGKVIIKYRHKISQEIAESKELVALLIKSTKQELTDEEKNKIKEQLKDILKTIPALAIFMLPGGSIILPVLFKVLPQHLLLPSSFQSTDNKPEEGK